MATPQIERSGECGNSPKNQRVEELSIALALGQLDAVREQLTEDVVWTRVGQETITGVSAVITAAKRLKAKRLSHVRIRHAMSHGKVGSVNGSLQYAGGERDFCDVFEFQSAKGRHVKGITSYWIDGTGAS